MKINLFYLFVFVLVGSILLNTQTNNLFAQEEGKGELEDFADDYGEEDSDSDSGADDAAEFFIWAFFENIGDLAQLWGRTPETEFGPYPTSPYAESDGFMSTSNEYRSYFFNTELNYHYLGHNYLGYELRSYIFKWETQFVSSSKLSFDFSVYEEDKGSGKDRLTIYGIRYGQALYRTSQLIVNLEGGFRGFQRNGTHGGVEVATDLLLFPKKPFIIETELAAAYVSNGPLFTIESSAGIIIGRFELLGGFRLLKSKDSILDGFRVGLRMWY